MPPRRDRSGRSRKACRVRPAAQILRLDRAINLDRDGCGRGAAITVADRVGERVVDEVVVVQCLDRRRGARIVCNLTRHRVQRDARAIGRMLSSAYCPHRDRSRSGCRRHHRCRWPAEGWSRKSGDAVFRHALTSRHSAPFDHIAALRIGITRAIVPATAEDEQHLGVVFTDPAVRLPSPQLL